jgi:hypothetical protein
MAVSLKENNWFFLLRMKLNTLIRLGVSPPSGLVSLFQAFTGAIRRDGGLHGQAEGRRDGRQVPHILGISVLAGKLFSNKLISCDNG